MKFKNLISYILVTSLFISCKPGVENGARQQRPALQAQGTENTIPTEPNINETPPSTQEPETGIPVNTPENNEFSLNTNFTTSGIMVNIPHTFRGTAPELAHKIRFKADIYDLGEAEVTNGTFTLTKSFNTAGNNRTLYVEVIAENGAILDSKEYKFNVIGSSQGLNTASVQGTPAEPAMPISSTLATRPSGNYMHSNNSSPRTGSISEIVLHNTEGQYNGAVSWLRNPAAKASAHYVIGRQGQVAQLVKDNLAAWHAGNRAVNLRSLGIEIEAYGGALGMTSTQEEKVIQLIKYWMTEHKIGADKVTIHRWHSSTSCPVRIWATDAQFRDWRKKHFGK